MATQTQVLEGPVAARKSSGLWRDAFGRLVKNRLAIVGLVLVALFGPWLAPYPYQQQDVAATAPYHGPIPPMTDGHVLGTDQLGRDLLSRIMDGAQINFAVAAKQLDATQQQGETVNQLLEQAAQLSKSLATGGGFDAVG